jgi:pimeloyl-ACP methyl ester carboxylesterase
MPDRPSVQEILRRASTRDRLRGQELTKLTVRTVKVPARELRMCLSQKPVLLVWGKEERLFNDHHLEFFQNNIPPRYVHALTCSCSSVLTQSVCNRLLEVVRPEGVGHVPPLDAPALVCSSMLDFISRRCAL